MRIAIILLLVGSTQAAHLRATQRQLTGSDTVDQESFHPLKRDLNIVDKDPVSNRDLAFVQSDPVTPPTNAKNGARGLIEEATRNLDDDLCYEPYNPSVPTGCPFRNLENDNNQPPSYEDAFRVLATNEDVPTEVVYQPSDRDLAFVDTQPVLPPPKGMFRGLAGKTDPTPTDGAVPTEAVDRDLAFVDTQPVPPPPKGMFRNLADRDHDLKEDDKERVLTCIVSFGDDCWIQG